MTATRAPLIAILLATVIVGCDLGPDSPPEPATSVETTTSQSSTSQSSTSQSSTSQSSISHGSPTPRPTTVTEPAPMTTIPSSTAPATPTAIPAVPRRLFGVDWERIPDSRHVVALTFDAGANDDGVASILNTLARESIPATFFLTGSFVDSFPASARAIASHRVGNHSFDHPHFTGLSDEQVRVQITSTAARIKATTGADSAPWFRFPYGDRDSRTIAAVNSLGYIPIRWTVDSLGWKGTSGGQSETSVRQRVLDSLTDGSIVLMHVGSNPADGTTLDADALPALIRQLQERGYSFVTLDEFLSQS